MKASMQMFGVRQLAVNIAALKKAKELSVKRAVSETVLKVRNDAVKNASGRPGPKVRTGGLRASIQACFPGQPIKFITGFGQYKRGKVVVSSRIIEHINIGPDAQTGAVTVGVPYAAAVEDGTQKTKAYPFLRPAVDANRAGHADRIRAAMRGI